MSEKLTYEELEAKVRDLEHEIAKYKSTEDKFLENETLLPRSQQIANVGTWKLDLIANRLIWSDEAYRIFGVKPKEFTATYEAFLDAVHPDDRKAVNETYSDSLHEYKGSYEIEHRIIRKDTGEIRYLRESYFHERNTMGSTISSIGMVQDITERVIAQEKLEQTQNRQTSLVNAISKAGIWLFIVDKDYCVRYMNELMIQSFGNAIGKTCYRDVKGDDSPCSYCKLAEVIDNGKMVNYESKLDDGRIFAVTAVPYTDFDGTPCKLEIIRDVTDSKQIENQLKQAQKMESIGTLASGIAHDFNNILSGIFGFSQLAEMHIDAPEKAKADIRNIMKGASRASELIQQILTFSRKTDYEKQFFSLFAIVKEVLKLIRSTIPATIEIKEGLQSKAPIYADPIQMHQVIMNLCTNAYHAMGNSGGDLIVRLNEAYMPHLNKDSLKDVGPKYLKLEISDTGHGMDKDIMEQIFDPYFTTKNREKGTGLGLALAKAIIEEHGGTIKVKSVVGKGSTFLLYLPIADKKENTDKENSFKKKIPSGTESILFVDDEKAIRVFVQEFLGNYGYTVTVSENGQKAYERFKQAPKCFDIVITDMTMPKMNGDKLASKILSIRNDIPIILCTGYSEKLNKERAEKIGVTKYIKKPIAGKELCFLIRDVLDESKKADES